MTRARSLLACLVLAAACRKGPPAPEGASVVVGIEGCELSLGDAGDDLLVAVIDRGELALVPKVGGKARTLARGLAHPRRPVRVAEEAWVRVDGAVLRVPLRGGDPAQVLGTPGATYGELHPDGSDVWVFETSGRSTTLWRVPTGGATRERVGGVPGFVGHFGVDPMAEGSVWFVAEHQLVQQPKKGSTRSTMGLNVTGDVVHADGSWVYAIDGRDLLRVPREGGPAEIVVVGVGDPARDPFVDARGIVVRAAPAGSEARTTDVLVAPLYGGALRPIARGRPSVTDVIADGRDVFWAEGDGATTRCTSRVLRASR